MSIYATLWTIRLPVGAGEAIWVEVIAQGVPSHIRDEGPAWAFLPPPAPSEDRLRAVVIVSALAEDKGTPRNAQEYAAPLLVLTGAEYDESAFPTLLARIVAALTGQHEPLTEGTE